MKMDPDVCKYRTSTASASDDCSPRFRDGRRVGGALITRGADYAVRALLYLAALPEGTCVGHLGIAAAIDVPAPFLGKVLQQLAATGLVTLRRGKRGGVRLNPRALESSLHDVICAIDGPPALNRCLAPETPCARATFCQAHPVWREAQDRAIDVLSSVTIASLSANGTASTGASPAS